MIHLNQLGEPDMPLTQEQTAKRRIFGGWLVVLSGILAGSAAMALGAGLASVVIGVAVVFLGTGIGIIAAPE
jgi:hypothetical protein